MVTQISIKANWNSALTFARIDRHFTKYRNFFNYLPGLDQYRPRKAKKKLRHVLNNKDSSFFNNATRIRVIIFIDIRHKTKTKLRPTAHKTQQWINTAARPFLDKK